METNHSLSQILEQFQIGQGRITTFGTGLINHTWKVETGDANYILQRINDHVFRNPENIAHNIRLIAEHLEQHHPSYFFVSPLTTAGGKDMVYLPQAGWFRLMPFVEDSVTFDVVETPALAREAAFQFGKFTSLLSELDAGLLKITIPDFHNLELRFSQFQRAINEGNAQRIDQSHQLIQKLLERSYLVDQFREKTSDDSFAQRVTHHDTKISNVLFDQHNKGICVIDLDTVMPGYFFSDVGDMMRTYLSPVSEEEKDFSLIKVRTEFYDAIVAGYGEAMAGQLSEKEMSSFSFAGRFMVYMQALRFATDHLNNDSYYGAKYEGHNFMRAGNQLTLLERMEEALPD